jgi:hypothetical protein
LKIGVGTYLARDHKEDLVNLFHVPIDEVVLVKEARLQPLHEVHHKCRPVRVVPCVVLGLELDNEALLFKHGEVVLEEVKEVLE